MRPVGSSELQPCTECVSNIGRQDGAICIWYYVYYLVLITLFGLLVFNTDIYERLGSGFTSGHLFRFLFYIPLAAASLLPMFAIMALRHQGLHTVGLRRDGALRAVATGLLGAIPVTLLNISGPLSTGRAINTNVSELVWSLLYQLICIALVEELIFRGFIQTRIQQLIHRKWVSVAVVGLMFAAMHIPFQMMRSQMTLVEFIVHDLRHLVTTFILHAYYVYLYRRSNGVVAPTIAHAIANFSYTVFV